VLRALLLLALAPVGEIELEPPPLTDEPAPVCAPPEPGFLTLDTVPWTIVYVDGVYAGSTPLFRHKLAAGAHKLTLANDALELKREEDVVVEEGRAHKLKLVLAVDQPALDDSKSVDVTKEDCAIPAEDAASLTVDTQPWSKVYVDGRYLGSTPVFIAELAAGDHVVRLVPADGRVGFARFTATPGETVKLSVALAPDPATNR
jgi:serine/threonine-protein kinase